MESFQQKINRLVSEKKQKQREKCKELQIKIKKLYR